MGSEAFLLLLSKKELLQVVLLLRLQVSDAFAHAFSQATMVSRMSLLGCHPNFLSSQGSWIPASAIPAADDSVILQWLLLRLLLVQVVLLPATAAIECKTCVSLTH